MRMLEGKVGLLTGAVAGIGWATAVMFAKEGAMVTAAHRASFVTGHAMCVNGGALVNPHTL